MDCLGRILVADDEETFLYSTADLLRREGYQCDCALDAATAIGMLHNAHYDVLIADIKMPGNVELEFIRDLPLITEGMPVILVTGYPSLSSAIQSIQLPVVAYMVKPIEFDELLKQVQTSIESFRVYCAVRNTRQLLQDWCDDLANIEKGLKDASKWTSSTSIDIFLELTFRNIISAMSNLKQLMKACTNQNVKQEVCQLLNCPRLTTLTNALLETIDILEQTKSFFKSKQLGELRQKLEKLAKSQANLEN
jgi:CheY-like chemotaxis protein